MNDHTECHHLLISLSDYFDGTLEEELCEELKKHLAECPDCRVVVNTTQKTIELYHQAADEVSCPDDVRGRLFRRLELGQFIRPQKVSGG